MKVILCRLAWMTHYRGFEPGYDPGNMNWIEKDEGCSEQWNFMHGPDGYIRGFVMLQRKNKDGNYTGTINITKLGSKPNDKFIEGVKVIFFANNPNDKKNYVVGWYDNATVYRTWTRGDNSNSYRKVSGQNEFFSFLVKKDNAFLFDPDERNIFIPSASSKNIGYPGQSNVFYGKTNPKFIDTIIKQLDLAWSNRNDELFSEPEMEFLTLEGKLLLKKHIQKERSSTLIKKFKATLENYNCSVCGFNFEKKYGLIGENYIEAHHIKPIMDIKENEEVSIKDLISVCSNCHRMLHKKKPPYTLNEIKRMLTDL